MSKTIGPTLKVEAYCDRCVHLTSKHFAVQGDSGYTHYCNASGTPRLTQSYSERTPAWCPFLAEARATLAKSLTPEQLNPSPTRAP